LGSKLVLVGRDENELDQTIQSCSAESKNNVFDAKSFHKKILDISYNVYYFKILKVVGDLTNLSVCKKVVDDAVQKFGKISILVRNDENKFYFSTLTDFKTHLTIKFKQVNSAGILKGGSIETMKMEDYEHSMNVNVKSVINLTQLCVPFLIAEKGNYCNNS
jgi:NADP-dependent 3-hydroxy acid dehydrogenase YdfG